MDTQERKTFEQVNARWDRCRPTHSPYGKVLGGLVLVAVGVAWLAHAMGVYFPDWVFSWPMFLVVMGVYIGAKHLFRNTGWVVMVFIGALFLVDDIWPGFSLHAYFWPVLFIGAGLFMILRPRRTHDSWNERWQQKWESHEARHRVYEQDSSEQYLDTVSVFGGVKKNIFTKDFKGGEVTCVFGGAEINLSQADFSGRVVLDVTAVLGGIKLIVPAHWEIQPEVVALLGGVEDKRPLQQEGGSNPEKVLVLKGTAAFGGIEIRSY